jgi:hypothetical protein
MTPGVVMYHTPQGIVYAPTTLQDASRSVFNFQQTPTALSLPQSENGQQIITIPIPVSLAATGNSQVKIMLYTTKLMGKDGIPVSLAATGNSQVKITC